MKISERTKESLAFYLWISPWLIGFLIWQLWPLISSLWLSFTNYRILNIPEFTGLENIRRLFADDEFWQSLRVTFYYVILVVPLQTILALVLAMILAQKLRGLRFWRTVYFLPSVVSGIAAAVMWWFIFNPDVGLANSALALIGIKGPGWLSDPRWALPSIAIIGCWLALGTQLVIYLAGIKGIPQTLYEAAAIDGANNWQQFWNITIPMLSPTIFFNVVVAVIAAFQVFDVAFGITNGGPNRATRVYVFNVYDQAFGRQNMGYASLLSWVLFLIILALTLVIFRVSRSRIYYEAESK